MRCLQGSFPRLKERFIYVERGKQFLMLKLIVLIHNFHVKTVGINQMRITYMPWLEEGASDFFVIVGPVGSSPMKGGPEFQLEIWESEACLFERFDSSSSYTICFS